MDKRVVVIVGVDVGCVQVKVVERIVTCGVAANDIVLTEADVLDGDLPLLDLVQQTLRDRSDPLIARRLCHNTLVRVGAERQVKVEARLEGSFFDDLHREQRERRDELARNRASIRHNNRAQTQRLRQYKVRN